MQLPTSCVEGIALQPRCNGSMGHCIKVAQRHPWDVKFHLYTCEPANTVCSANLFVLFFNLCLLFSRTYHPLRRLLFTGQSPSPPRFVLPTMSGHYSFRLFFWSSFSLLSLSLSLPPPTAMSPARLRRPSRSVPQPVALLQP